MSTRRGAQEAAPARVAPLDQLGWLTQEGRVGRPPPAREGSFGHLAAMVGFSQMPGTASIGSCKQGYGSGFQLIVVSHMGPKVGGSAASPRPGLSGFAG